MTTIGETAYLLGEQFFVVGPGRQNGADWRQSEWNFEHYVSPFVTCMVALDAVTEENGALYLLPYSRSGIRKRVRESEGYKGPDAGIPIIVPAGSITVFSSFVFFRHGSNLTNGWHWGYGAQYSSEPARRTEGAPADPAEPILLNGVRQ